MEILKDTIVYPLPDIDAIKEREGWWRLKLPEDFKNFIMQYNGGVPDKMTFYALNNPRGYALMRFLCILDDYNAHGETGWYDISVTESLCGERLTANKHLLGVEVLPIGEIFAGDLLCLDFRKNKDAPTVCVWSHEESGDFDPVTYFVANSFTEFLEKLTD